MFAFGRPFPLPGAPASLSVPARPVFMRGTRVTRYRSFRVGQKSVPVVVIVRFNLNDLVAEKPCRGFFAFNSIGAGIRARKIVTNAVCLDVFF